MLWTILLACQSQECPTWHSDVDGDGYGDPADGVQSCAALTGRVDNDQDCDDRDPDSHPGAVDILGDGIDQDCDGAQGCDGLPEYQDLALEGCPGGRINIIGTLSRIPEGDCVCSIEGDLSIEVGDDLNQLASLQHVGGSVRINSYREEDVLLPGLVHINNWLRGDLHEPIHIQLPALTHLAGAELSGVGQLELPALVESGTLSLWGYQGQRLHLESLEHLAVLDLRDSDTLEWVVMAPDAHLERLQLEHMPSLSSPVGVHPFTVDDVAIELGWEEDWTVTLTGPLLSLTTTGEAALTVLGVEEIGALQTHLGYVRLPDLRSLESLYTSANDLSTPALESLWSARVLSGTWSADRLGELQELEGRGNLDLPSLEHVESGELGNSELPALLSVGDVSASGSYPLLRTVTGSLTGSPNAPSLTHLEAPVSVRAWEGQLPALRSVSATLELERAAELPALQTATAPIVLDDVETLSVPNLSSLQRIELRGGTAVALPDPLPGSLWTHNHQPETQVHVGTVQGGLSLWDGQHDAAPWLHVDQVQGNMSLSSKTWTGLGMLQVDRVEGDLSYCLPKVSPTELATWLDTVDIAGAVEENCS